MNEIKDTNKFDYLVVHSPDKRKSFGYGIYDIGYTTTGIYDKELKYYLKRDKSIPNYDEIVRLEKEYFEYNSKLQEEKVIHPALLFGLFFLAIIPMIIYLIVASSKQKKAIKNNVIVNNKLKDIKKELSQYIDKISNNDYIQLVTLNTYHRIDERHHLIEGDICKLISSGPDTSILIYKLDNQEYEFEIDNEEVE